MEFRLLEYGPSSPRTDRLISCLLFHLEPSGHTLSAFSGILQPATWLWTGKNIFLTVVCHKQFMLQEKSSVTSFFSFS